MDTPLASNKTFVGAAADVFNAKGDEEMWQMKSRLVARLDPFVQEGSRFSEIGVDAAQKVIESSGHLLDEYPNLVPPGDRPRDLMVVHEGLGVSMTPDRLVASAFTAALEAIYYLGLPQTEDEFRDRVLKNLDELKGASVGKPVEVVEVVGLTGPNLPGGRVLNTPWGLLRGIRGPAIDYGPGPEGFMRAIRLVLCVPRQITIPIVSPPVEQIPLGPWKTTEEGQVLGLLALAFLLADSNDQRAVPIPVWSTTVHPFAAGGSYTVRYPFVRPTWPPTLDEEGCVRVEGWCQRLEGRRNISPGASIAGSRLISAVSQRPSPIDSLVDAVVAWESLVGSKGGEITFRVTAALAKLIEADPMKRVAIVKQLKGIYSLRSKAVHGEAMDMNALKDSTDAAIGFGIAALQRLYEKNPEWFALDSTRRSDRLLLQEP